LHFFALFINTYYIQNTGKSLTFAVEISKISIGGTTLSAERRTLLRLQTLPVFPT